MKKNLALKICLVALLLMVVGILSSSHSMAATSETVKVAGKYHYDYAKQVLDIVNQERAKNGKSALKMTKGLFETANQRAAELAVTYDSGHLRPDGTQCFTAFPSGNTTMGENIAMGQITPEQVMNDWMNSDGHRKNILGIAANYTTIGIGCFEQNGILHWVQCFGNAGTELTSYPANQTKTVTVPVKPGSVEYYLDSKQATVEKGNNITLTIKGKHAITGGFKTGEISFACDNKDFTWKSGDEGIATVVNGVVTAKKSGKVNITATKGNTKLECLVTVAPALEKIEISAAESNEIKVGQGVQFDVVYLPTDAINHPVAKWESSDPSIATVTNGMVKGLKPGTVTITVKAGGFTATRETTIVVAPETTETETTTTETGTEGTQTKQEGQEGTETKQEGKDETETKQEGQEKTKTKNKLDPEPKTGTINTYAFIATLLTVSILGIVIYTKKIYK